MRIEHLALWTKDLERLKAFYTKYFGAAAGPKYTNPSKGFESYFLEFSSGARLELMTAADLSSGCPDEKRAGPAHFAVSAGSKEAVVELTGLLRRDGLAIVSSPPGNG